MWPALLLAAALPVPGAAYTADDAHAKAVVVHDEAVKVAEEGKNLLKDLDLLGARYRSDMDVETVAAEREALRQRVLDMQRRYQRQRRELLELRKENQHGQLVRLFEKLPKEQFAAGLMEALDFNKFFADIEGFNRRIETALKEDAAAFAAASRQAEEARGRRLILLVGGALAVAVILALAALPRRTTVKRLE